MDGGGYFGDTMSVADVTCGQSVNAHRGGRIVGGQDAVPREFPWMVSITRKGGHICGGTILSSKFVLTAAHCFCARDDMMPAAQIRVTVGEHDLHGPELPGAATETVRNMIIHPDFECGKYSNDIALLELRDDVAWSDSVKPACLPPQFGDTDYSVFSGEVAVAAGWGWLGEDKSAHTKSHVLQKVGVNVIEDKVCSDWYASQGKVFRVKYGQMCAGHENGGRDACAADSGGPLMVSDGNEKTMVIGIVSTGIGCARKRLPGIYTRVSEFVPWIFENARK
ncbi:trypsin-1-like [Copidosoma floridanum]|uniref:trypsin-1-like n=1 Tax=Copidosoma floridanum TaxID=29053 RepID=UPI0006C9D6FC|nr:trypsin-1-like [Copidosoma floridanum]